MILTFFSRGQKGMGMWQWNLKHRIGLPDPSSKDLKAMGGEVGAQELCGDTAICWKFRTSSPIKSLWMLCFSP